MTNHITSQFKCSVVPYFPISKHAITAMVKAYKILWGIPLHPAWDLSCQILTPVIAKFRSEIKNQKHKLSEPQLFQFRINRNAGEE
jgi:hypothetical protein